MKKTIYLILSIALVAVFLLPQASVEAADPLAQVKSVSLTGGGFYVAGILPCGKWKPYAITTVGANRLDIMVYRRSHPLVACALSIKPFGLTVKTPALVNGQTYSVYVNGRFKFNIVGQ